MNHVSQLPLAHGRKGGQPPRLSLRKGDVGMAEEDPVRQVC